MQKTGWTVVIILFVLLASGCAQRATPTATPTVPPSATRRSLPPTWTAGPSPTSEPPTATTASNIVPALGATALTGLPPTWTPAPFETSTLPPVVIPTKDQTMLARTPSRTPTPIGTGTQMPTITPTYDLTQPPLAPAIATFPAGCSTFTVDLRKTSRVLNAETAAQFTFTTTTEADNYRLWVLHPDGRYVFSIAAPNTTFTIPGSTFVSPGAYGWELVAFNKQEQVCAHLTGVFVATKAS